MNFDYDIIVIGGGAGGITSAKVARGFGKRVALVEKTERLGGDCTWTGCIPSKTLIKAAQVAFYSQQMNQFGLHSNHAVTIDTTKVMEYVRSVRDRVSYTHTPDVVERSGIKVLFGGPMFLDAHSIQLGDKIITAKNYIIATGSSPFVPPIEGIDRVPYVTNETLFDLDLLPKSMIILGGGFIGVEMASALNRLGVHITLVEMQERILSKEDPDPVALLTKILKKEGVILLTGMRATKVMQKGTDIILVCEDNNQQQQMVTAATLLVAVGRKPNIDLRLDNAQVKRTKRGILVSKTLRTTAANIYACGDVVGPYKFSHMAWYQAVIATRNAIIPLFKKSINYNHVIWVTFTAPEFATVGITEQVARNKYGDAIQVYRYSYDAIDRGYTDGATDGLVKFICDKKGKFLGAHIVGERAGDIIHEVQLAKTKGIPLTDLQSVIHAYPTYAELNWQVAKSAYLDKLNRNILVRCLQWMFIKRS